jgi:hypothetical protein
MMHVHFACPFCVPVLHIHNLCPWSMSMSIFCMSRLLFHVAYPCCTSLFHVNAVCSCFMSMSQCRNYAAWTC